MDEIVLSDDQQKCLDTLLDFYKTKNKVKKYITMGGYAGVGKSFLIGRFASILKEEDEIKIAFCAFTGKAAQLISSKLKDIGENDFCGTIHSLIYIPIIKGGIVTHWMKADKLDYDLIVVDEASMVNREIFQDLLSFNIPIIAIGDHGQLPPISGELNLMDKPDIRLEKIHRQAEGSAIIQLSMIARKEHKLPVRNFAPGVRKIKTSNIAAAIENEYKESDPKKVIQETFLCGYNSTRVYLNRLVRQMAKIKTESPIKGDKVICLRNNRKLNIFNGMGGIIEEINPLDKSRYDAKIKIDGNGTFEGEISRYQFGQKYTPENWNIHRMGDLFDFGYALTTHKAQGSQSEGVVVIEERLPKMEDRDFGRWLYTAVTRAQERILIIERE